MPKSLLEIEKELKNELDKLITIRCENSLAEFTKHAWHIIEPGTKLIWNWHLDTLCAYLEATVDPKIHLTRLIINIPPGSLKSVLVSVMFPAWLWIKFPAKRVLGVSNAQDLSIRDSRRTKQIITDEWFTHRWPLQLKADQSAKTNYENSHGGFRISLGITANITGKRGDFILMDDPMDASTAQSDIIRQGVLDVYDTKLSTRVNSQEHSVFILIMQRLHSLDLTGHLLNKVQTKWTHVVMPMHYDKSFTFDAGKDLGRPDLNDPRKDGELLFPALFPQHTVDKLEEDMGEYACTPAETPITMWDGSIKAISQIEIGDVVLGYNFTREESFDNCNRNFNLRKWYGYPFPVLATRDTAVPSVVTEVFKYEDHAVLEYTMEDDTFIRSTRDHKWYKPTAFDNDMIYSPISCFNIPGKDRFALPLDYKRTNLNQDLPSLARVTWADAETRAESKCEYTEYKASRTHQNRRLLSYKIYDNPVDRASLNKVKYYKHRGRQTVYALTTETGNYVAWNHLSSNSAGQLEQRPSPKGGGILRESWFRILDESASELPICDHVFISCDTAYSEKDMVNNSFSAFTTWGVFWNKAQQRDCILLLDVWYDQVDYPTLRRHAHKMDEDKKPDVWLIEKKASGLSLVQDLRHSGLLVRTYIPTTDKVSRAYAVQPMLESGQVWIPDRKWARTFAYKMGTFPTGDASSMDLADTCTQALLYIRNGLYVTHPDDLEHKAPEIRRVSAYGAHSSEIDTDEQPKSLVADEVWRD